MCPTPAYTTSSEGAPNISACVCLSGAYNLSSDPADGCGPCNLGYYSDGASPPSCLMCPAGTYDSLYPSPKELLGRSSRDICSPCPDHSVSQAASISIAACTCNSGYWTKPATGGSFSCVPCGLGHFSPRNSTACSECGIGNYSEIPTASACSQCPLPLKTLRTGSVSVNDCSCECGTELVSGQCIACRAGWYGLGGGSPCSPCPITNYTRASGQCVCKACNEHEQALDGMYCSCIQGYYNNSGTCSPCPPGTYANKSSICNPCPSSSYNPFYHQTVCTSCPDTSTAAAGINVNKSVCNCSSSQLQADDTCPSAVVSDPDKPTVTDATGGAVFTIADCPAGQEPDPGTDKQSCRDCAAGKYKNLGSGEITDFNNCVCCPGGTYKPISGTMGCTACPTNSNVNSGGCGGLDQSSCQCNAGYFSRNSSIVICIPCNPGTYSAGAGATGSCADCQAGYYQNASGAQACISCPPGASTWNKSSLVSKALTGRRFAGDCSCDDGYSKSVSGACSICPAGTYTAPFLHDNTCVSCPAGKYSMTVGATTDSACITCKDGSYSNSTIVGANSSSACKCFPGYTGQDGDYCSPCDFGTYKSLSGSSPCLACPIGFYQNSRSGTVCLACPQNAITLANASRSVGLCLCSPGYEYFETVGGPSRFICRGCAPGQYKNATGNVVCLGCPPGFYNSNSNSTSPSACVGCPTNSFTSAVVSQLKGYTSVNDCKCNKGFEGTDPNNPCTACSPGTFKDWYGTGLCTACGSGFYQPSYSAVKPNVCTQCPPNTVTGSDRNDLNTTCRCKLGFTANCDGVACSRCPAGTYKDVNGSSACTLCPLNTYSSLPGANSSAFCLSCPSNSITISRGARFRTQCLCGPGYTLLTPSSQECAKCTAGKYKSSNSSDPCIPCSVATYGDQDGMTACLSCLPNMMTANVGSSSVSACLCNAGYTGSQSCSACLAGQYKTGLGSQACTNCSIGYFSTTVALDSPTCKLCPKYSTTVFSGSNSRANCVCRTGYYDTRATPTPETSPICVACLPGKFRDSLSSPGCSVCPIGTHAIPNGSILTCTACPPNMTTANNASISLADCLCKPGFYRADRTDPLSCRPCLPGTYSDSAGPYPCDPCKSGAYSEDSGASSCTACSAGFITLQQGSSSHTGCICDQGYELASGTCVPCAAGKFKSAAGNTAQCEGCARNTYANVQASTACIRCALFASTLGNSSSTASQCECLAGYYGAVDIAGNPDGVCLPCPVGTFKNATGSGSCMVCPTNLTTASAASTSADSCRQCIRGTASQCATFECQCRACSNCTAGQYLMSQCNDTHDTVCGNCTGCVPGRYTERKCDANGPATCTCCQLGTFSVDGTVSSCQPCPAGTYSPTTCATSCSICQSGFYQTGQAATNCTPCELGKYQPHGSNNCSRCEAGTYQNETGKTYCIGCEAGKYSTGIGIVVDSCDCCPNSQYQKHNGMSICSSCPAGKWSNSSCSFDEWSCQSCTGVSLLCSEPIIQCQANYFQFAYGRWITLAPDSISSDSNVNNCPACGPGAYSEILSSDSGTETDCVCIACGAGKFSSGVGYSYESSCAWCEIGTFSTGVGFTACTRCRSGSLTRVLGSTSSKDCVLCDAGQYVSNTGNCSNCPVGKYSSSSNSSCQSCQPGTYSLKAGSSSCTSCERGKYSTDAGQERCKQCSVGSFSKSGQSFCDLCSNGKYAFGVGATSCERLSSFDLSFGDVCSSCDTTGGKIWSKCSQGTYQSSLSVMTGCLQCAQGSAQSSNGATACILCSPGTYQSSFGGITCQSCNLGEYQSLSGGTNCLKCIAGQYQSSSAQSKCSVCSPGTYSSSTGSTSECNVSSTAVIAPPPAPQGGPPVFNSNAVVVTLTMVLPYTKDEFTDSLQLAFTYSMAETLNVYPQFISLNIQNRRRGSAGLTVDAVAKVPEEQGNSIRSAISNTTALAIALNSNLQNYGLKDISGVLVSIQEVLVRIGDKILSRLNINSIQNHLFSVLGLNTTCVLVPSLSSDQRFISLGVRVPLSLSDLDSISQNKIIIGISQAAEVNTNQVNITSMLPLNRRSSGSTNVFIQIDTVPVLTGSGLTTYGSTTYISTVTSSITNVSNVLVPTITAGSDNSGKIIGGAVGGSLGFLALIVLGFLAMKRSKKDNDKFLNDNPSSNQVTGALTTQETKKTYQKETEHQEVGLLRFEKPTTTFV